MSTNTKTDTNTTDPTHGITGWFRTSEPDARPAYCSVAAALQQGLIRRHEADGLLQHYTAGRMSFAAAIEAGLIDAKAAEVIAQHPNIYRPRPAVAGPVFEPVKQGPLGAYEGTPAGDIVTALQQYVSTRSADDARALAEVIHGALEGRK